MQPPLASVTASSSQPAYRIRDRFIAALPRFDQPTTHAVCHGADAKGVEGLGLTLAGSQLVADSSQAELVELLKAGRMPGSPDSITGIPMPSFAWMPQGDLEEVAGYLKTL